MTTTCRGPVNITRGSRFPKRYWVCSCNVVIFQPDYNGDDKDARKTAVLLGQLRKMCFLYWKQYTHINIIHGLNVCLAFSLASCVHSLAVKKSKRRCMVGLPGFITSTIFGRRVRTRILGVWRLNTASEARYGPQAWGFSKVWKANRAYTMFSHETVKTGIWMEITCLIVKNGWWTNDRVGKWNKPSVSCGLLMNLNTVV